MCGRGVCMAPDCMWLPACVFATMTPAAAWPRDRATTTAMLFRYSVHPKGLDPFQAAKAWHLRVLQGMPWKDVRLLVRTVSGMHPGQDALEDAVARVDSQRHTSASRKNGVTRTGYTIAVARRR